jgi:p-hydroxybenzoate 3-monooxygenase
VRTQVAIVGAGPAGLLLAHLLHLDGIESIVLEDRDRDYVEQRVRAGLLEQGTVDLLTHAGVADRLHREGLVHHGIILRHDGRSHRIPITDLVGRNVTIYGQQEVVRDLIAARLAYDAPLEFEVSDVAVHDFDSERPRVTYTTGDGDSREIQCDYIAGCDGFHGVCRPSIPAGVLRSFEHEYPFGWLGILAHVKPSSDELVYARHEHGFSLLTMRSNEVSRLYLQVPITEKIEDWSDDRIWAELQVRQASDGWTLQEGPIFDKAIAAIRSFVVEPMQYGRLFLAGDAAHIVPPTGAKGLNLAVHDVFRLSRALIEHYASGSDELLNGYTDACLSRVWRAQDFSTYMTTLLHRLDSDPFALALQDSRLRYAWSSQAAATSLAENYAGLPYD